VWPGRDSAVGALRVQSIWLRRMIVMVSRMGQNIKVSAEVQLYVTFPVYISSATRR
jgi:hypothetical protein